MSMTSVSASPPCRLRVASVSPLRRPPADLTGNRAKQTTRSGVMGFLSSPVALWAPARKSCQCRAPLDELPRSAAPLVCAPFGSVTAARYEPRKMDPTYDHLLCALNSCISLTNFGDRYECVECDDRHGEHVVGAPNEK